MRTRSQSREQHPPPPEEPPVVIEPLRIEYPFQEDPPVEPMADTRTMAQLLQAPTEGYEDAILIPEIVANNFELKHGLINLVQNKQFFGHDKEDPHAHIRYFNKITSTMRVPNVPIATIKLMLFPFSIEGAARIWLEKEPPRSIQTWDDLVSKFINQFFPPSKTTNLRNEITRFQQRFDESFYEAWDRFNDLLRACPHHGFSELHQIDTFYNALNINDQDSLNSAAGGNFLDKMPRECLKIIESKSKVRQTRAKAVVAAKILSERHSLNKKTQASASAPAPLLANLSKQLIKAWIRKSRNQANEQIDKFYEIFKEMSFEIKPFNGMLLVLMPKSPRLSEPYLGIKRNLLKWLELPRTCLARTSMNEHLYGQESVILNKFTQKTWRPRQVYLIPCEFPGMEESLALARILGEPPLPPPSQGTYLPEVRTELKVCETNTANSSIDEPTEVELKELPPHLEYAFLEGDNKLPVIIAKELDVEEKSALIKVLKSHKRALAWKLSDIQGINPEFCTTQDSKCQQDVCTGGEESPFRSKGHCPSAIRFLRKGFEVDKAKIDVIAKLPHPTTVKGIRSFLGHAGFTVGSLSGFLKNMPDQWTQLLEKNTPFIFSVYCIRAFQTMKDRLNGSTNLACSKLDLPFELMCDASDFVHRSYLIMNKSIVQTDHTALSYLFAKEGIPKDRLLRWVHPPPDLTSKVLILKSREPRSRCIRPDWKTRSGYHQKDRKPSQNDKTEHGMEKTVQNQGQSPKMPKSESILKNQQSNRSRN
ncbi:reverse transcriptase domain-containing protein [Tanacetum coccineum]